MTWERIALSIGILLVLGLIALLVLWWRSSMTRAEAIAYLREQGGDLVRLPGRLRRLAGDPRTPRRARWWLIGLAIYIASPIDPIPDIIPVLGHLDELVLVPIVFRHIRRMIPQELWDEYFPRRPANQVPAA